MRRAVALLALAGALLLPAAASAALTHTQAISAAKRLASAYVSRFGVHERPARWRATCRHLRAGGWRCAVYTRDGRCVGALTVYGTSSRPHARHRRIGCDR
jgi:predicted LPLAT superfamily acyltransferase